MPKVKRRAAMASAARGAAAVAVLGRAAHAQGSWPDRPVRLIIGYPAGGPTDFGGRLLQDPLQQLWGQPLVIENRAGASGIIATEMVAKSAPDGYTLFLCASTHTSNPALHAKLPYDSLADFTPIVLLYTSPTVLFTGPDQPYRTIADVVAAARKPPGLTHASSGVGTSGHFAMELFRRKAGIEMTNVAYRGAAPALQDVIGGRIPVTFSTLSGAIGLVRDGKLRPLAIAGPNRTEVLPGRAHARGVGPGDHGHQPVVRLRRAGQDAAAHRAPDRGRRAGAAAPARHRQANRGPGRLRGGRRAGGIRRTDAPRGGGERRGGADRRHPHRVAERRAPCA